MKVEFRRATLSPSGDHFSTFNNYWDASQAQITPNDPNHTPGVTGTVDPNSATSASEGNAGTILGQIFEVVREPGQNQPDNTNNAGNVKTGRPDLKINGEYGDVYTPTVPTANDPVNTTTIIGKVKDKGKKQGTVIVIDIFGYPNGDATTVINDVTTAIKTPKGGMKEVDVIIVFPPDGSVQQIWPQVNNKPVILRPAGTNTNGAPAPPAGGTPATGGTTGTTGTTGI